MFDWVRRSRAAEHTFAFLDQRRLHRSIHPELSLDTALQSSVLHVRTWQSEATSKNRNTWQSASTGRIVGGRLLLLQDCATKLSYLRGIEMDLMDIPIESLISGWNNGFVFLKLVAGVNLSSLGFVGAPPSPLESQLTTTEGPIKSLPAPDTITRGRHKEQHDEFVALHHGEMILLLVLSSHDTA